jgi:hypothetical protein
LKLHDALDEAGIHHVAWREQPENIFTALATKPYRRADLGKVLDKCQLMR